MLWYITLPLTEPIQKGIIFIMKPNIVLLATISCFLLGCHSETDGVISAEEARTNEQIALIKKQKAIEKEKERQHNICKDEHIEWIKNQIKSASRSGENGTFIATYYCEERMTKHRGCYSGFSCESETNDFIATLKQNGYTVEEKENEEAFWDVFGTHYVSWSSK